MKSSHISSRRQFLSGIFSAGVMVILPLSGTVRNKPKMLETRNRINALMKVMHESAVANNDVLREEQKANLVYAFKKIRPSDHLEEAVVVAFGLSYQPVKHMVDEYVWRRSGGSPRLPDNPLMALNNWGMPKTYNMLIFREQVNALLAELTGNGLEYGRQLCNKIMLGVVKENSMAGLLCEKHKGLNREEIKSLYDAVQFYAPMGRPYIWCSTMVSRADAIYEKSLNKRKI